MLLHTMSSLFGGTLSPWLGCFINLVCLGITLCCYCDWADSLRIFFPCGKGADSWEFWQVLAVMDSVREQLATVLLIRMYGLVVCSVCGAAFCACGEVEGSWIRPEK